jgi:hypothetical protein
VNRCVPAPYGADRPDRPIPKYKKGSVPYAIPRNILTGLDGTPIRMLKKSADMKKVEAKVEIKRV